ncbi:MAG TPA: helix-turn-helix transcriptional regulator [Polyangia bacterium]|jgi:transcriptional regulator with XRE-family HTH domain/tetratricopeptide (TPR) repeat protein|nr:helix-turn-helix transcriptional regulator [Polyangia bacterium]
MARLFNHALLLKARLDLNLTQEQAAAAVHVDVRTYRRYESGAVNAPAGFSVRSPTRRRMLSRLAIEFGISEVDLLIDSEQPRPLPAQRPPRPTPVRPLPAGGVGAAGPAAEDPDVAALATTAWHPLHLHTLQRARHFAGRADVLDLLIRWVGETPPHHRVVALRGVGGMGKTAVADRFVSSLGEDPRPGGLLVWSFYEDLRSESFLTQAADYFGVGGAGSHSGDRFEQLLGALRLGPPHLLVLDGLETIQAQGGGGRALGEVQDPFVRRLLWAAARGLGNTRILVTSRFELTDLAAWEGSGLLTLQLGELAPGEALQVLERWGIRRGAEQLLEQTGGHPLSVAMMGSYVGALLGGDARRLEPVLLDQAARDDLHARRLAAVLAAYARALATEERDLLARLAAFPVGVTEEALLELGRAGGALAGSLAGWSRLQLRQGLARLERLGLVFASREPPERYMTHPFVRQYFQGLLQAPTEAAAVADGETTVVPLERQTNDLSRDRGQRDAYEALLGRMLAAGHVREAYDIYARSLGGFGQLALRLGEMRRGQRIVRAFAQAAGAAGAAEVDPRRLPVRLPPAARAVLTYDLGLYSGALGELEFACRCYQAFGELGEALGEPAIQATSLRTLAYTERLRGRLTLAHACIERSLALSAAASLAGHADHLARGQALRAAILCDRGETAAADELFAGLRASGEQTLARRGLWEAELHLMLGRYEAACDLAHSVLDECRQLRWAGHVAHAHTVLGLGVLAAQGDTREALGHLGRARRWVQLSGEVEMALRCLELAARIALARKRPSETVAEARAGVELAERYGFGLWRTRLACLAVQGELLRRPAAAVERAEEALRQLGQEDVWGRADLLHWGGLARARSGDRDGARRLLAEAAVLRQQLRHPETAATRSALAVDG